jgi:hypothetical protein
MKRRSRASINQLILVLACQNDRPELPEAPAENGIVSTIRIAVMVEYPEINDMKR